MECFWGMYCHWCKAGNFYWEDPPVFYLYFFTNDGLSDHHLPGVGFLEKYAQIYLGGKKESLVLFVKNNKAAIAAFKHLRRNILINFN